MLRLGTRGYNVAFKSTCGMVVHISVWMQAVRGPPLDLSQIVRCDRTSDNLMWIAVSILHNRATGGWERWL